MCRARALLSSPHTFPGFSEVVLVSQITFWFLKAPDLGIPRAGARVGEPGAWGTDRWMHSLGLKEQGQSLLCLGCSQPLHVTALDHRDTNKKPREMTLKMVRLPKTRVRRSHVFL